MLFLLFQINEARYALDTAAVLEIIPRVTLQPALRAPVGVAGLLDYHGTAVPVLDLSEMASGRPAPARFSTRLILARTPASGDGGTDHLVGLLAERATSILRREPGDFTRTGLQTPDAPYLGPVTADADGFIHLVRTEGFFTGAMRALFAPALEDQRPC